MGVYLYLSQETSGSGANILSSLLPTR